MVSALLWLMAAPLLGAAACALPGAPSLAWTVDLVANLSVQCLLVTAVVVVAVAALRRWGVAAALVVACAVHAGPLVRGRQMSAPAGEDWATSAATPNTVRLLHFNASSKKRAEEMLEMIRACGADIVSITEPDWRLQSYIFTSDPVRDVYPYQLERHYDQAEMGAGAGFVLSRWPIEAFDPAAAGVAMPNEFMAGLITLPSDRTPGSLVRRIAVVALHPRSPRSAERWVVGNEVVEGMVQLLAGIRGAAPDAECVLLADFNSTPTGFRSRRLQGEGLRRAKPLLSAAGTYPTGLAWPLTIAIDDAMITPGLRTRAWRTADPLGSDHWPVLIELEIDYGAARPAIRDIRTTEPSP